MKTVYVVMGVDSSYSDFPPITLHRIFEDMDKASAFAKALETIAPDDQIIDYEVRSVEAPDTFLVLKALPTWRVTCVRKELAEGHPDRLVVFYVEAPYERAAIDFAGEGWESVRVDRVPTIEDHGKSVHEQILARVAP